MRRILSACLLVPGLLLGGVSAAAADRSPLDVRADREALAGVESRPFRSICSESVVPGFNRCFAKIVVGDDGVVVTGVEFVDACGISAAALETFNSPSVMPVTGSVIGSMPSLSLSPMTRPAGTPAPAQIEK